jgi:hypothetical protein
VIDPGARADLPQRIDSLCDHFEQAWRSGLQPRLEVFLASVAPGERPELLLEMLAVELECRRNQGEEPHLEEYRSRFPLEGKVLESAFLIAEQRLARSREEWRLAKQQRAGALKVGPAKESASSKTRRRLILSLLAVLVGGGLLLWWGRSGPLSGELKVSVRSMESSRNGLGVHQPGALPILDKDKIQIEVRLEQPAHVYLLWIDSDGDLTPLYPWNQGTKMTVLDAKTPPPEVPARVHLFSPEEEGDGWSMAGPSGLETIVLLARRTPVPGDMNLAEKIGKQKRIELRDPRELAVRGMEHGQPVSREKLPTDLFRLPGAEMSSIEESLKQMMNRLKDDFELIRVVQFAHESQ